MYNKYADIIDLSMFYEEREKCEYINELCDSIERHIKDNWVDKNAAYNYSIWGLTQASEAIYHYISANYPNAKLCHVYDTYKELNFEGIKSIHPDNISKYADEYVFVTTPSLSQIAKEFFDKIGKKPETFAVIESNN